MLRKLPQHAIYRDVVGWRWVVRHFGDDTAFAYRAISGWSLTQAGARRKIDRCLAAFRGTERR